MYRYVFEDSKGNKWERVNAIQARNAFMRGETVTMCPHKLRPWGFWNPQFTIFKDDETHAWELQHYGPAGVWDWLINSAIAYNCNHETGYYLAYYLQK